MNTKLTTLFTLVMMLTGIILYAQIATPNREPLYAHIYGKVIDRRTGQPIKDAVVLLVEQQFDSMNNLKKDVPLKTALSDQNGEFNFVKILFVSHLHITTSALGYQVISQKVTLKTSNGKASTNINVGNILLQTDTLALKNLIVNSSRPLLQLSFDKRIYNVEKDISATGGTAADIMKNVPSLSVDLDGNVTLRNATPQIFVDGRPTTLTLEQIPADQVSSIEIITNPSARYDAGGGGSGIVNIVLKKTNKTGYSGNLRSSIDSRGKPTFGGDFSIKKNKVNYFAAGNLAFRKTVSRIFSTRVDTVTGGLVLHDENSNPVNKNVFGFLRAGIDYFVDNRNTLTLSGNTVHGDFRATDLYMISTDSNLYNNNTREIIQRYLNVNAGFVAYGSSLGFKHLFERSGRELTADANYIYNSNHNTSQYKNHLYDAYFHPKPEQSSQLATGGGSSSNVVVQADYIDPFSKTQKFEFGVRASLRSFHNWNDNYLENITSREYILLPAIGVRHSYNDQVLAGYASYSKKKQSLTYQAGLRVESSEYKGNYISRNKVFSNSYPLSLFPSVFLSYSLNKTEDVQFNIARKINRPNFFQLIPFVDFSDSLNLFVGNPSLRPEFTNLIEMAYSGQYHGANSILFSLYGKQTNKLIIRYQFIDSVINPLKPGRYISYANADNSVTAGLEVTGKNHATNRWDIVSSLNIFHVKINAENLPASGIRNQTSWFAKINNTFKLPASYTLQVSGEYQAKTILPPSGANSRMPGGTAGVFGGGPQTTAQGYLKPSYGADIALKKEFLKNNAGSLTLQFSDIFRSRVNGIHSDTNGFSQDYRRYRDPQLLRLNFNWRFGKFDAALFKRRNVRDSDVLQTIQGSSN